MSPEPLLVLGLVPARGGSKGVPGKNVRPLAGAHAARLRRTRGARIERPRSRDPQHRFDARSRTPAARAGSRGSVHAPGGARGRTTRRCCRSSSMRSASSRGDGWSPDIVVLLQPTSPLRRPDHIRDAVAMLRETEADSVVTVVEAAAPPVAGLRDAHRRGTPATVSAGGRARHAAAGRAARLLARRHGVRVPAVRPSNNSAASTATTAVRCSSTQVIR